MYSIAGETDARWMKTALSIPPGVVGLRFVMSSIHISSFLCQRPLSNMGLFTSWQHMWLCLQTLVQACISRSSQVGDGEGWWECLITGPGRCREEVIDKREAAKWHRGASTMHNVSHRQLWVPRAHLLVSEMPPGTPRLPPAISSPELVAQRPWNSSPHWSPPPPLPPSLHSISRDMGLAPGFDDRQLSCVFGMDIVLFFIGPFTTVNKLTASSARTLIVNGHSDGWWS